MESIGTWNNDFLVLSAIHIINFISILHSSATFLTKWKYSLFPFFPLFKLSQYSQQLNFLGPETKSICNKYCFF
jgi:hypothetical protein